MTLHVELVVPDREVWSGSARMVIAKTLDGDIGVLSSHPPVIGLLAEGSVVRIVDAEGDASQDGAGEVRVAVSGGFLSVAGDRVSILARQADLSHDIDVSATRAELDEASAHKQPGSEESAETRYARARLQAAGEQA